MINYSLYVCVCACVLRVTNTWEFLHNREKTFYYTSKLSPRHVKFAPFQLGERGGITVPRIRLFIHRLYVGFMRRQMEEKHDWRVFIVNVRDSTLVR